MLVIGATHPLGFTLRSSDGSEITGRPVTWSSGNEAVATVSGTGVVTAVGEGTAQISATREGRTGLAIIRVQRPPVASLTIVGDSVRVLERGESAHFIAVPRAANGSDLNGVIPSWTTSNESIVWVSDTGGIVAQRGGSAVITATAEGRTAAVRVLVPEIEFIDVLPKASSLAIGEELQAEAVIHTEGGTRVLPLSWASENEDILAVSASGRVTALRAGIAVIRASAEGVDGRLMIQVQGERRPFPATKANGQPLPLTLGATTWEDESGTVRAAELILMGGALALLEGSRYQQRLYVGYRWDGEIRATDVIEDEGVIGIQLYTGNPILMSETFPGRTFPGTWEMTNGYPTGSVSFEVRVGGEGSPVTIFFRQ